MDVTAVVAYNDLVARGAASTLEESGLRTPEDMSVIGCDDISLDDLPVRRECVPGVTKGRSACCGTRFPWPGARRSAGRPGCCPRYGRCRGGR
ncbi:substrate-binding domain-containing protein [Streptomyces sp. NPDC005917]|uniref:substrate-binding domain-containing protein n=1 Tax=unclassified Streptomyces TaxID=2593676 RepID=UPI0033BFEA18